MCAITVGYPIMNDVSTNIPRKGATIYAGDGSQYEFGERLDDVRWIVYPIMEAQGWEGSTEYYTSDAPQIVNPKYYYPKPPKSRASEEVATAKKQLAELRQQIKEQRASIADFEKEEKARMNRLKQHEQLKALDDFIAGKITHVVTINELKIIELKKGINRIRLLSIFGETNGDLGYCVYDTVGADGRTSYCMPASSLDDARNILREHVSSYWDNWAGVYNGEARMYVAACKTYEFPIPPAAIDALKTITIKRAEQKLTEMYEEMKKMAETYKELIK